MSDNMKNNLSCNRSRPPPPAPSSWFSLSKGRSHVSSGRVHFTMQSLEGSKSSSSSLSSSERNERSGISLVLTTNPKDISDCVSSWVAYLQMLSGLCSAGSRLSHSLISLIQDTTPNNRLMMMQCQTMWEELIKASTVASSNIRSSVLTTLQEFSLKNESEVDAQRTSQVIFSSLVTFINLQYQFSAACCECLGPIRGCNCLLSGDFPQKHEPDCSLSMTQQYFQRLFPITSNSCQKGAKSPSRYPLSSFQILQRRWSEAAAQEVGSGRVRNFTMRRWSMPWESTSNLNDQNTGWTGNRFNFKTKLTVPVSGSGHNRSRSLNPASQEELQEVIKLLSYPTPPMQTSLYHPGPKTHLPGVTLTGCSLEVSPESWSEATTPSSRRGSHSPHRGSWAHTWGDSFLRTESGYELHPATLASRKSSSSTDSSSSHSLHSRSTTGSLSGASGSSESGGPELRTNLYSMWSGTELPFLKLPESNEPIEEHALEPQPTPTPPRHTLYTPKSH